MESHTIDSLLKERGAWLKAVHGNPKHAQANSTLSRLIADNYVLFEQVRDTVLHATEAFMRNVEIAPSNFGDEGHELANALQKHGMVLRESRGNAICEARGKRYMSGGWLEELAWLAAIEAGAHEAIYGQVLGWQVKSYTGENEIDLIARHGSRLCFVSCKALRSELDMSDRKHRNRLMDAVHEADNLADHFGRNNERVAVLVTTDLYDEVKDAPRYNSLMGKAAVLDVKLIALESLSWEKLVSAMRELWTDEAA